MSSYLQARTGGLGLVEPHQDVLHTLDMALPGSSAHLPADVVTALERDLTIDITTKGRKSGEMRRIEIWFLNVDGTIYITGTPGRRDWYANLLAEPSFVFHLKETVEADLRATAHPVDDLAERRRVFESDVAHWYRANADNDVLIGAAPMVRVTFP